MVNTRLLIVDEPFLGLDPIAIADLVSLLEEQKERGTSILMSTHVLDSAEKMCDRFVILHQGQVLADGNLFQLQERFHMPHSSLNEMYLALTQEKE